MPSTLLEWLDRAASRNPTHGGLRFIDGREHATHHPWRDVFARAQSAAGALQQAGVQRGDRVAILLPTHVTFTDAFFGCAVLGAIPVPLYPPVRLGRMDEYIDKTVHMLRAVQPTVLITDRRIRRALGRVMAEVGFPLPLLDAADLAQGEPAIGTSHADDVAMIQFSSGTTASPKPVALTHRQCLANAERILAKIEAITPQDGDPPGAGVCWLPLYHDMGLIGCIFPALLSAGPLSLIPPEQFLAKPAIWLRTISRYQGTISPAPNFAYALCVQRIRDEDLEGVDLSSWKMALDGAEPISAETLRHFATRFAPWGFDARALMPVYGLSEASLAITFTPAWTGVQSLKLDRNALRQGEAIEATDGVEMVSSGIPLPDFAVEIRDDAGRSLPEGRVGQIVARGPSVMRGYYQREEQPIEQGWLHTGDLGFLHDGQLFVTGRAKDLIGHRGRNHAPQDLERAVFAVPGVREGCAAAVGDVGPDGERVLVFVEIRDAQPNQAEQCVAAITATIGISPDLVVLLTPGTLPRTSSGKIRRAEALRRWHDDTLTPPRKVGPTMIAGTLASSFLGHLRAKLDTRR